MIECRHVRIERNLQDFPGEMEQEGEEGEDQKGTNTLRCKRRASAVSFLAAFTFHFADLPFYWIRGVTLWRKPVRRPSRQ